MKKFFGNKSINIVITSLIFVFLVGIIGVSAQTPSDPLDENTAGIGGDVTNSVKVGGTPSNTVIIDSKTTNTAVINTSSNSNTKDGLIGLKNPLKVDSIGGLVQTAVEIFSYLVIMFAVVAFIWVGLQYILARGNAEKMKELSKWLGYIVIGVAVVIGARVIISIVINTLSSTKIVDERIINSAQDALKNN
jgi:hypothetical protein